MNGLNIFKRATKSAPAVADDPQQKAGYIETPISAKPTFGFKRKISFHVDQSGIQLGCSSQLGVESKLIDARKLYFPSQSESEQARAAFISDTIAKYVGEHGGSHAEIALSASGPETAFRVFNMPELSSRALASAVNFEAKRQVPFPPNECHFDFRPVSRIQSGSKVTLKVALHAATNRAIEERLAPFRQLGYDVAHVYHTHDVIGQLLRFLPDYSQDQHYTLINVEKTRTEISYYRGSNLEFYHNCSIGSSFLARRSDPTVFEYFAESLAGEIQNSLDFYTGQYSGLFTTRIYIHGDLAYTDELLELLHNRFGYEFRRFPTETLSVPVSGDRGRLEEMSVCLPVLASAVCSVGLANLIPAELMSRTKSKRLERAAYFGAVALAVILMIFYGSLSVKTSATKSRLQNINNEIASFQQSTLFDTYNVLKREIAAGNRYLENIKSAPSYFALLLKEISNRTPQEIQLANLNYQTEDPSQNIAMDGLVISSSLPPEVILAEYVETLQRSPLFESVTIQRYTKRTENGKAYLNFSMSMRGVQ
ncbi:MAG: pilus assembly protein PilM [bacterium]|nr:pilus assembly protein PilM [bacterium]